MIRLFSAMMICLALAACGGGGGGGGDSASSGSNSGSGASSGGATAPAGSDSGLGAKPAPPPTDGASGESTSVNLSWTPPTARENGEPLPMSEILGYEIYYYVEDSSEGETIRVNDSEQVSYSVEVPGPGIYHFAMTAVDINGLTSDNSNFVSVTID